MVAEVDTMIYTLGIKSTYDSFLDDPPGRFQKKGRTTAYPGGSVWKTYAAAEAHRLSCPNPDQFAVYGVVANWEFNTAPNESGGDWHDLLIDARIVLARPPGMTPLTDTQQRYLNFIVDYKAENDGLSPTVREIADGVGVVSSSTVFYMLAKLEELGVIRYHGRSRGIIVVGGCWSYDPNKVNRLTEEGG